MTLQELQQQHHFDPEIIRIWTERESAELLPIQAAAIQEHHILEGKDLLVSAPTSSGKTFLAEIAAIHSIFKRQKVIYLLPLKALAEEKYTDFLEKYEDFGLDVVISTGDRTEFDATIERGDFQIAILVFEKANRLLVRNKNFLDNCGLIIVDEIQMTADFSRGSSLEMLLTSILYTRDNALQGAGKFSKTHPQLIALSAVIGDLNRLDEWLGLDVLLSDSRPVELQEGILRHDGSFISRGFISKEVRTEHFTPFPDRLKSNLKSVTERREYEYKRLKHYVSYLLSKGEQLLIFRKWKWLTRTSALRLAQDLQLPPALEALEAAQNMEDSISKGMLLESLRHGVAFHNADLGRDERRIIEEHFKAEKSKIRVICATSTLAMGINLPVKTVIVNDLEKPDPYSDLFQEIPLSSSEYKNMSGRAGRLKRQDEGRSIIFSETPADERILWRNYIEGSFPQLNSLLADSSLLDESLFLPASGLCRSQQDLIEFMKRSYAGVLVWNEDRRAFERMQRKLDRAIEYCVEHELMVRAGDSLQITEIGRICAIQGVSVESFVLLQTLFQQLDAESVDFWGILFPAVHNREIEDLHFRLSQTAYESGEYWRALRELQAHNYEALTQRSEEILQSRFEVTKRIKMSLLLLDWIQGLSLQELELKYGQFYQDKSYSGVIRSLAENVAWMLRLLKDIAVVRQADLALVQKLQLLSKMVLYGVDERAVELAALYVPGLTRAMLMRLADAGYSREEHVLEAELEELMRVLPREIAFRLQDRLYKKYSRTETRHLTDQKLRLERLGYDPTLVNRIYSASDFTEFHEALIQLFRTPQLKLLLQELVSAHASERFGKDYLLEGEKGRTLLRILPPNLQEVDEEHFANLLSCGVKYNPAGFVLIGRPDFTEASYSAARQFSESYSKTLRLYPAYDICERYVQILEGTQTFLEFDNDRP